VSNQMYRRDLHTLLTTRYHMPCRVCKAVHTNPMSSSICNACGVEARKKRVVDTKAAKALDAEAAYLQARAELKEYIKEKDND
jgi:ribosomal protein L37E